MKNILDSSTQKEIENRILSLNENSNRLWGKMGVNEMICHCSDQVKMADGLGREGNQFLFEKILE